MHGDLSEYNILYYKKQVWIIDVGQAVQLTHPHATKFLCVVFSLLFSFPPTNGSVYNRHSCSTENVNVVRRQAVLLRRGVGNDD